MVFAKRAQVIKPIFPFLKPTYLVCTLNKERSVLGISLFSLGGINLLVVNFNAREKVSRSLIWVQYLPATTTITRLLLLFFVSKLNSICASIFYTCKLAAWGHASNRRRPTQSQVKPQIYYVQLLFTLAEFY